MSVISTKLKFKLYTNGKLARIYEDKSIGLKMSKKLALKEINHANKLNAKWIRYLGK